MALSKVRLLPVELSRPDISGQGQYVPEGSGFLAEEAWTHGPLQPRSAIRQKEVPAEPVDLETLAREHDLVELLPSRRVRRVPEIDRLPRDVSAYVVRGANRTLLRGLCKLGRPILPDWDKFGYSWHTRGMRRCVEETGAVCLVPMGAQDVIKILRVLRVATFLREMCVLCIGDIASRNIRAEAHDFDVVLRSFEDLYSAVKRVDEEEAEQVGGRWSENADVLDGRQSKLPQYAKTYLGLRKLLAQAEANALTMDCAYLRTIELCPCYSFANLIDDGTPSACERDFGALLSMTILMNLSGGAALHGNLFANCTHEDIEGNVITINHDVVPPSMAGRGKQMRLRDFHATGKGLTGFVELEKGKSVTVLGLDTNTKKLWYSSGVVAWTEDTVHCRTCIGVKVPNAKRIAREFVGGHQTLGYGNWTDELEMLSRVLGFEALCLE